MVVIMLQRIGGVGGRRNVLAQDKNRYNFIIMENTSIHYRIMTFAFEYCI